MAMHQCLGTGGKKNKSFGFIFLLDTHYANVVLWSQRKILLLTLLFHSVLTDGEYKTFLKMKPPLFLRKEKAGVSF